MSSLPDVSLGEPAPHVTVDAADDRPETGSSNAAAAVTVAKLPDSDLNGHRMGALERAWRCLGHLAGQAMASVSQVTSRPGGINAMQPESPAQYWAHVKGRSWVPDGYTGRLLIWVPHLYYYSLGAAGVYVGCGIKWLFGRMLHFNVAATVIATSAALWWLF